PGDAGSQVFAKLNKTEGPHIFCFKKTDDYFQLWLNLELLAPLALDCWVDNMKLIYNNKTRTTSNTPGVEIKIPQMGDTFPVEYLDTSNISVSMYFGALVTNAVKEWGYERNRNIVGVPYDFRRAPNEQKIFFEDLRKLIERTYYANGNKKVAIVAHSMGNSIALYLYNQQTQMWKDKFIASHVGIAAPWGGSAKVYRMVASGYNMDHYRILVSPLTLRTQQRSMPSTYWLLPSDKFWNEDEAIIKITEDDTIYTTKNYEQFFKDLNFQDGWDMYQDTKDLSYEMKAPGVEIHCIYGVGLPTPEKFVYAKKSHFPDTQPDEVMGDGDGTVNVRSIEACQRWRQEQSQPVYIKEIEKWEHLEILQNREVIDYVKRVVLRKSSAEKPPGKKRALRFDRSFT
uniref:Group XV phospholipase A2 n=1 Tax=Romanomermis culicivorax TaxID=13658 RepID=A0A915K4A3_ROMCU